MDRATADAAMGQLRARATRTTQVRTDLRQAGRSTWKPEALAVLAIAAWLAIFWSGPLINDVGWQLWVGRQINNGRHLYSDILEVNPPLWFWLGAVIERLARLAGTGALATLTCAFAACSVAAVVLVRLLLPDRSRERLLIYAALISTLLLTSPFALGQREQFTAIVMIPYIVLVAKRGEGDAVGRRLAFAAGLFAAAGFALKHYFVLVPLALEGWLLWRTRRFSIRPELVSLCLVAAVYLAAIALFAPTYLTTMVPLIGLAYGGFGEPSFLVQLGQPLCYAAGFALLALWFSRNEISVAAQAAAIATAGWILVYLLQGKGFAYQAIPALGSALLSIFLAFGIRGLGPKPVSAWVAALLALVAAVMTPLIADRARYDGAAVRATAALAPGSPFVMLSASGTAAWPLVEEKRLGWPSRHMTYWMLTAVWTAAEEGRLSPQLERLGNDVRAEVARSIACTRPTMILADTRYDRLAGAGGVVGYFARDPGFVEALGGYERAPDVDYLQVYRARGAARPPNRDAECRAMES